MANDVMMLHQGIFKAEFTDLHTEQKISDLTFLEKFFHLPKFLTTFFSHLPEFHLCPVTSTKVQLHTKISYNFFSHSLEICCFSPLFSILTLTKFYNCTIHLLLQLQITFYNCRNCDQLHVKICPGLHVTGSTQNRSGAEK